MRNARNSVLRTTVVFNLIAALLFGIVPIKASIIELAKNNLIESVLLDQKRHQEDAQTKKAIQYNVAFLATPPDPLVTDDMAYQVVMRFISGNKTTNDKESVRIYMKSILGIKNADDQDILLSSAVKYKFSANKIQKRSEEITAIYHPDHQTPTTAHQNTLSQLNSDKTALIQNTKADLQSDLPPATWSIFSASVINKVKPYIKTVVNPTNNRVAAWNYTFSWQDVVLGVNSSSDATRNDEFAFITNFAAIRITARSATEINPAENIHGIEQTIEINNLSLSQSAPPVSEETEFDNPTVNETDYTATTSWDLMPGELTGTNLGPFSTDSNFEIVCNFFGGAGGNSGGSVGTSFLRFDYSHYRGLGSYVYAHMAHSNPCPAQCAYSTRNRMETVADVFPGARIRVIVPFGPLGCLVVAGVEHNATAFTCFDISLL